MLIVAIRRNQHDQEDWLNSKQKQYLVYYPSYLFWQNQTGRSSKQKLSFNT